MPAKISSSSCLHILQLIGAVDLALSNPDAAARGGVFGLVWPSTDPGCDMIPLGKLRLVTAPWLMCGGSV